MDILNVVLWVVQALLALAFIFAGSTKAFRYNVALQQMGWVKDVPKPLETFIGIAETLGGIGVILPRLTGVLPWLTPVAAAALAIVMLLATGFHIRRSESPLPNIILLALAAFVAYGRFALVV